MVLLVGEAGSYPARLFGLGSGERGGVGLRVVCAATNYYDVEIAW